MATVNPPQASPTMQQTTSLQQQQSPSSSPTTAAPDNAMPLPNNNGPILYEELHRRIKEIQPMIWDGIRLTLSKPLTPHFQISHSISMGLMNSSYKFGSNFMGTKQVSPVESYPVLASEMQCDGQLNANLIHQLTPRIKAKLVGSFARNQCTGTQMGLDYRGDNFTTTLTAANIDFFKNTGIVVGHLLHQFTKSLCLGPELVLQYGEQIGLASQLSLGGRYKADNFHIDTSVSMAGTHISYCQKANENLHFGVELLTDSSIKQSEAAFYYQYDLTGSHTSFKGGFDSSWNVMATLEKRFFPLPITFALSAALNHPKNSTTVGIGLTVGQ